ncbi:MFS transporter [uncultured Propionibacterium sp.]|uniref:MFS transporter n=1 Tax=uncultured Propionibacterium sp. TaxID=218066 RepID=UPI00292EC8C2|nr:MFS transporter [uncultured Propionibacterium sp.]
MTILAQHHRSAGSAPSEQAAPRLINNYFDGLPVRTAHRRVFILVMIAYFFDQLDNWNFGYIAPALRGSWGLDLGQIARINSAYFVGMTVGGLLGGFCSDRFGRRKVFMYGMALFSACSLINGLATSPALFAVARAVTGVGLFAMMVCSHTYLAELSPGESRGRWQGRVAAAGYCAVPVIGIAANLIIPLGSHAWRALLFIGGLGIIPLALAWRSLPESPRWLVAQGRLPEAERTVRALTGYDVDLSRAAAHVRKPPGALARPRALLSRANLTPTVVLLVLFALETPASFIVRTWITTLLDAQGMGMRLALVATFCMQTGVPFGCWVSSRLSDLGGRKWSIVALLLAESALALAFGHLRGHWALILVGFLLTASGMAVGFISYTYATENYPTGLRNSADGVHNAVGRSMVAAVQPLVPGLFASAGFAGVFSTIAVGLLPAAAIVAAAGRRTGGRPLEEIS